MGTRIRRDAGWLLPGWSYHDYACLKSYGFVATYNAKALFSIVFTNNKGLSTCKYQDIYE